MEPVPQRRAVGSRVPIALLSTALALSAVVAVQRVEASNTTPTSIFQGQVVDTATGLGIANAWIAIGEMIDEDSDGLRLAQHAFTDSDGRYTIALPVSSDYWNVAIHAPGYINLGRKVPGPVLQDSSTPFQLEPVADSVAYWGQLTSSEVPFGHLMGVEVWADGIDQDFVAITDDLGRFAVSVGQDAAVTLEFLSAELPVTFHELKLSASMTAGAAAPIDVLAVRPQSTVTTAATLVSTGLPAAAGTTVYAYGLDANGELVFEDVRNMGVGGTATSDFGVDDGVHVHTFAVGGLAWGHGASFAPVGTGIPVAIDDQGGSRIDVQLVLHESMPSGSIRLEAVVEDAATGVELTAPLATTPIDAAYRASWSGLAQGTYRLVYETGLQEMLIDQLDLKSQETGGGTYLLSVPAPTPELGTGTGDLAGSFTVAGVSPSAAVGSTIDVTIYDPRDGRILREVSADSAGSYSVQDLPAGDWSLAVHGQLPSGVDVILLEGPVHVAIETGVSLTVPPVELHPAIGLFITAYSVGPVKGEQVVAELGEYTVQLYAGNQLIAERGGNEHGIGFGSVPPFVDRITVRANAHQAYTQTIDLTQVDPLTHFEHYMFWLEVE